MHIFGSGIHWAQITTSHAFVHANNKRKWRKIMKLAVQYKANKALGILLACMAMIACAKSDRPVPVRTESEDAASPRISAPEAQSEKQVAAHAVLIVAPDKTAPADLPKKLAEWKAAGLLSNVVLIKKFGAKGDQPGFDELALLESPSEAAYEELRVKSAADLGPDVIASRVDILLDRRSKNNDPSQSIFVVGQYESLISQQEYQEYTDAYIEPNMANQMFSGIMTRYTMYLEREATGGFAHPRAILVTEYANQAEYDRKKAVKDAYKVALLSTHPEWTRINGIKDTLRTDLSETYANPVKL